MIKDFDAKSDVQARLLARTGFHVLSCNIFYFAGGWAIAMRSNMTEKQRNDYHLSVIWNYAYCLFTNWNLMFQTMFLTISLVYDIMEWLDHHESSIGKKLKYVRDVMFCGLVVPLTLFISSMFWTLFWIDRELVFPEIYDQLVPWWFNHCVHTNITIVVLVETILQARRHPTNFKLELALNGAAGVLYAIVYYSIFFFAHRWLYAVFGLMTWWQICLYQLMIWASTFIFYFIQFPINRIFHREESDEETSVILEQKNGTENGNGTQDVTYTKESNGVTDSWLKHRSKNVVENSRF